MGVGGQDPKNPKCEEFTPKMGGGGGGDPKMWGLNAQFSLIDSNPSWVLFSPSFGGFGVFFGFPVFGWGGAGPKTPKSEEFTPKMGGGTPKILGVNAQCSLIDSSPNLGHFSPNSGSFLVLLGLF